MTPRYASVIFPLALPRLYTYSVPEHMADRIARGMRVEVSLKNKLYSAIIYDLLEEAAPEYKPKPILAIMDETALVTEAQLKFWHWMADYYCCTMGEVLGVAMPSGLKLESETRIVAAAPLDEETGAMLSDDEYLVAEAVHLQNEVTIGQIQDILSRKTVYPVIRSLIDKKIVSVKEELIEKFRPRTTNFMTLTPEYAASPDHLSHAIALVEKSDKQTRAFLSFVQLSKYKVTSLPVSEVCKAAGVDHGVIQALAKKGIFTIEKKVLSRILSEANEDTHTDDLQPLSQQQETALTAVREYFKAQKPVLMHGVTGSGKTRVYADLIHDTLQHGKQVLYLLPEIALTTHMVQRLRAVFGTEVLVYHSRMNNQERVEMWNTVLSGGKIVIAARSGLFLPYNNLGLIIVDEEHDPSFKQNDPNPRYNARDAAVFLAHLMKADIIMGSATPSLETYSNAISGKYGLVTMTDRHGESVLPKISVVDLRTEYKDKRFNGVLSYELITSIKSAIEAGEQVLLFQNRRGYAPALHCNLCGWKAGCNNCDVHLTIHKAIGELRCHYCGVRTRKPERCPACGSTELHETGFGTEKIEEIIRETFPDAKVGRLDLDTARTKAAFESILQEFEEKQIDILVGTQMITKGLDFDNISLVGILNADSILRYPDLRANERAFQLMTQVSGRAGRRQRQGRVIIQTFEPSHPVIVETMMHLYDRFYDRESRERKQYGYPPFFRMISIEMLHKNAQTVSHAAEVYAENLRKTLGSRLIGPAVPGIERLRGQYIRSLTIKMEKDPAVVARIKSILLAERDKLQTVPACRPVRINIDVDPY